MFNERIMRIMGLSLDVSSKTDYDVFFTYAPHCNLIEVHIYEDKWDVGKSANERFSVYIDVASFRSESEIVDKLDQIIDNLSCKLDTVTA